MPQGDKSKYTAKQKRQADHIEKGYEEKGVSKKVAKGRAWATVNKTSGGGKKVGGSGSTKASSGSSKTNTSSGRSKTKSSSQTATRKSSKK